MANTTADKLAKLNTTKADLKAALAEKGQTVGDVFSTYPAAVRAIEMGGGTVIGTLNQISFLPGLIMVWSDGETGYYEHISGPHDAISVIKNSCIYLQEFQSISGGVSEIKFSDTTTGGEKVYFVYDNFTLTY